MSQSIKPDATAGLALFRQHLRECARQIDGKRGLSDATLSAGDGDRVLDSPRRAGWYFSGRRRRRTDRSHRDVDDDLIHFRQGVEHPPNLGLHAPGCGDRRL